MAKWNVDDLSAPHTQPTLLQFLLAAEKAKAARLVDAAKLAISDACADDLDPWIAELRKALAAYEVKP